MHPQAVAPLPVFLVTDFGPHGPYLGQVRGVLAEQAPGASVIDLINDVPRFDAACGAHLLAAVAAWLPRPAVVLAVVDPGVGTASRRAVFLELDGRWFVGPDNGLFHVAAARASARRRWEILWRPRLLSASFHGRDLFAPVAAALSRGTRVEAREIPWSVAELQGRVDDLPRVIYRDWYGNLMTGLRAAGVDRACRVSIQGQWIAHAETFGATAPGALLWYSNSQGLVEVAANQASAAEVLGAGPGAPVSVGGPA